MESVNDPWPRTDWLLLFPLPPKPHKFYVARCAIIILSPECLFERLNQINPELKPDHANVRFWVERLSHGNVVRLEI